MPDFRRVRHLLRSRRPGHALPRGLYTDVEAFAFDLQAIFHRAWIMAGAESELPHPGSSLSLMVGNSPIIIVRDRVGALRAFHNSCRHRGAMLCPPGRHHAPLLTCPYHQWAYDLTGTLIRAPRMQDDFDPSAHGLKPVHLRGVAGCLYVCLADDPPAFDAFHDGLAPLLSPHDLGHAKLAHEAVFVEKANWKLVMENARECYHCAARHPALALAFPTGTRANFAADPAGRVDRFNARMASAGLAVGPTLGPWWQAVRFPLNDGVISMTMDGGHVVSRLMIEQADGDVGSLRWATEPSSFCHALGDHVFMFSAQPMGPDETRVTVKWLVHKDAVEGVDYQLDRLVALWLTTNNQDIELVENNQLGVNSIGYEPGPYCEEAESLVIRFTDWYCETAERFLDTQHSADEPRFMDAPRFSAARHATGAHGKQDA